jgi:energy-coupling factor transport system substrate-specific component
LTCEYLCRKKYEHYITFIIYFIFIRGGIKMKNYFKVSTKTIVATGLGAAIFMLLFMYVKVPSPIPETSFQTAYGLSAFFAALFGPIAGALISFIGHALSDAVQYGSPWWSWVIASGVSGFIFGFSFKRTKVEEGEFRVKDIITFNVVQIIGNIISWIIVAPVLDIVIYKEPSNLVFTQGVVAALMNSISAGVIGTLLLIAYAKTRTQKGSLTKNQ